LRLAPPLLLELGVQPLLLSVIAMLGCREAQLPYPALAQDCSLARIGTIVVNGASVAEVAPIAVLEGTFDDQERTRRVTEVATELLHVRGYPQATVAVARREACGVELEVAVQRGPRFRITQLGFATDDAFPEEQRVAAIADALGTVNAVGGSYVADRMERALANLERRYHESGWIDAVIRRPIVSYDQDQGAVTVVVPIQAGSRYRIGAVRAHGAAAAVRAQVVAAMGLRGGEYYDASRVRTGLDRARRGLDRRIELRIEVAADRQTVDVEARLGGAR
jgi:outer membrane protein assembly factor BamA